MILLLTNERDLTTDYVVLELQRRQIRYLRLNTERLAETQLRCVPTSPNPVWEVDVAGRTLRAADVSAAYFRRPGSPIVSPRITESAARRYCEEEWEAILRSLYAVIGDRWLNSPDRIAVAENKPLQLMLATRIGLRSPETLITNDHRAATEFIAGGPTIGKPLHAALYGAGDEAERVIFTTRIDPTRPLSAGAIEAAPLILQREIAKRLDIRATVVGENVFAAEIESQGRDETSVDWRRGSYPDIPHARHELPESVARMCATLVRLLGLRFAALDLVLDRNGAYWFLEANPNGQWAWIENRTGLPICSAIVDLLVGIGSQAPRRA